MAIFQELLNSLRSGKQIVGDALPALSTPNTLPASAQLANAVKADTVAGTRSVFKQLLDSMGTVQMNPEAPFRGNPEAPGFSPAQVPPAEIEALQPESVMSMPPQVQELLMSLAPAASEMPAEDQMAAPDTAPGQKAASAGAGRGKGVGGRSKGTAAGDTELEALLKAASKTSDRSGERGTLDKQRQALLAKAESEKELSNEEKVAVALLGALPGLVGAIGGGAIAGGYGAAAGAAGGLQGGAAGVQSIAEAKSGRRKEAKTEAQVLAERIAKLDDMMAAEKTRAGDKQLEILLGERSAKRQAEEHAKNRASQWAIANLTAGAGMQKALLDAQTEVQKKLLEAKAGGADVKEYQGKAAQFATSMLVAKDALDSMRDPSVWNTMTTWSGLQSALSDPKRQEYARAAFNFIDAVTRDVSGAAITPTEWEVKFRQYLPALGSSPQDMARAKQFRDSALQTMLAKAGTTGSDIALRSYESVTRPQAQTQSSPEDIEAIQWAKANRNDPRALQILQMHGIK